VFKQEMTRRNLIPYLPEPGQDAEVVLGAGTRRTRPLPPLLQSDLAVDFLKDNQDFALIADVNPMLLAAWTGQAWEVRSDRRLLSKAVADHLSTLYALYPPPADGRDRRGTLKAYNTLSGVVHYVDLHLPTMRREQFDTDEYLLGLPGGMVADLRTGKARPAQRTDYVSRCLTVAPATHPTPRWTRFLLEIACGDRDLAEYLRRLCALCLTAHPEHAIYALYGSGRNGKGSFIRVLEGLLGSMAVLLRPRELTESKWADDANKRTLSTLEGARLVCVQEAKTDNLDFPLLKVLSGGDSVSAAAMRMDARQIKPTWKLFLTTNEQPIFPADAAFRGRVHLVPFRADFSDAPETTIDATLRSELPGILAELIALCPSVIRDGLEKPAAVKDSTDELFTELDVAGRFITDCLPRDPASVEPVRDVRAALEHWMRETETDASLEQVWRELRKRLKPACRKVAGKNTKVFIGVNLLDGLPAQSGVTVRAA
jgi:putative DNA primase/helicase